VARGAQDHAGAIAPPPLIFGLPLAVALYEDRSNPLGVLSPRVAMIIGGAIIFVALVILVATFLQFRRRRTTILPYRPTTAIVLVSRRSLARSSGAVMKNSAEVAFPRKWGSSILASTTGFPPWLTIGRGDVPSRR